MSKIQILTRGIIKDNPIFVLLLGICPMLGTTSSAMNGLGMGIATMSVLLLSNIMISLFKNLIPNKVRIPAYIVIITTLVTALQLLMNAYTPALYNTLGVFIPLIATNCLIFARVEAFASKNNVVNSAIDGLGTGFGFLGALVLLGTIREILGTGTFFGHKFIEGDGVLIFVLAPGAFIALGFLIAIFRKVTAKIS
ncbi:MAG: electron transport complex subunit RsxE [Rikenellaceae bacterium]|nr:electron transport complex subunit RsxE [Rikenellaceae bacterium]MCL2692245.1 electron transport complex subunit RsxE [Rikenellaceae bacterium]